MAIAFDVVGFAANGMDGDEFGGRFFDCAAGKGEDFVEDGSDVRLHFPAHTVSVETNHGVTLERERRPCQTVEWNGCGLIRMERGCVADQPQQFECSSADASRTAALREISN